MLNETYLCFQRGQEYYAIDENKIVKILFSEDIFELPIKEESVKGLVVVDDKLVGIVEIGAGDIGGYYIIIDLEGQYVGICADEIIGNQVIQDDDWISQEEEEYPFRYQDEEKNILYITTELIKRRLKYD